MFLAPTQLFSDCLAGWERLGTVCYLVYLLRMTWNEAQQFCIKQGAQLVSIHSQKEQNLLKTYAKLYRLSAASKTGIYNHTHIIFKK